MSAGERLVLTAPDRLTMVIWGLGAGTLAVGFSGFLFVAVQSVLGLIAVVVTTLLVAAVGATARARLVVTPDLVEVRKSLLGIVVRRVEGARLTDVGYASDFDEERGAIGLRLVIDRGSSLTFGNPRQMAEHYQAIRGHLRTIGQA